MPGSTIRLLLIEDNPGDVRLAQEALREVRFQNTMDVVSDGEEALEYLSSRGRYAGRERPDLILLDMNLPRMDGFEFIEELAKYDDLRNIPVVILAATRMDEAILKRYGIAVDCFIMKPLTMDRFLDAVKCFPHLGITIVKIATA